MSQTAQSGTQAEAYGTRAAASGPTVVFTYAASGIPRLRALLEGGNEMEWIAGLNLVELCDQLARGCQAIDGSADRLSALAKRGIGAVIQAMLAGRLAGSGKPRWCTPSVGGADVSADTFLSLFPQARFVCLHRHCRDVIYAGIGACPWGLADTGYGFDEFAVRNPGNSVAAMTEYWAVHTERMLGIEDAHPGACMRVRYEDMDFDPAGVLDKVCDFLGLPAMAPAALPPAIAAGAVGCGRDVPAQRIPRHLLAHADGLLLRLGYRPLTDS